MSAAVLSSRLRIVRRVRRGVAVAVLMLVATSIGALLALHYVDSRAYAEIRRQADDLIGAAALDTELEHSAASDRAYLLTGNPHFVEEFWRSHERFMAHADMLFEQSNTEHGRQMLAAIIRSKERHAATVDAAMRTVRNEGLPPAAVFADTVFPSSEEVSALMQAYVTHKQALLHATEARADRQTALTYWGLVALVTGNAFIAIIVVATVRVALGKLDDYGAKLRRAVAARDEFLAIAGHELRTPLSVIRMQSELLRHRATAGATLEAAAVSDIAHRIERNADSIAALITRLVDAADFDRERIRLERGPVELVELVRDVHARLQSLLETRDCHITIDADTPVHGHWDRARLEQVVVNLITNAVRHACPGTACMRIQRDGQRARLTITDDGPGIRAEDRERIFNRFERGSGGSTEGMGIGLALSRDIVRAHGGELRVEPVPGRGACFVVELPIDAG